MANLTATPSAPNVDDAVSFVGDGFTPGAECTLSIDAEGVSMEAVADAAGYFGSTDVADHATTTLTSSGVNVTAGKVVTIGAVTYTFRVAPGAEVNAVKIGNDAAATLVNLKKAINLTGVEGTDYGTGTEIHPTVFAGAIDATTLKLHAKTGGTGGNALASTTDETTYSFPGATFNSGTPGTASTDVSALVWHPTRRGTFVCNATDGTNSASCTVRVWE